MDPETPQPAVEQPAADQPPKRRAGRPKGSRNKLTNKRLDQIAAFSEKLNELIPDAFKGNSLDFLLAIFKDPKHPMEMRMDAAKACLRFQVPALNAVEMTGAGGTPLNPAQPPVINVRFVKPEPKPE